MARSSSGRVAGLLLFVLVAACRNAEPPQSSPPLPSSRRAPAPPAASASEEWTDDLAPVLPPDVKAEYESARDAVRSQDYARAQIHLEKAVELLPDFTEGWYNLGATYTRLAIEAVRVSAEQEGLALFHQAVDAKRKARDLMDQGRWYVYLSETQQAEVRSDVEKALEDADEVMADEASLLAGLRLWGNAAPK